MTKLGNKEVMSSNIKRYMLERNISRTDLCDAIGVKYTTLTDWIKGNTYPRIDWIERMANYFGIRKSDLVEEHSASSRRKGVRIPVLGRVAAGVPIEAIEEVLDWEEIPEEMAKSGDYFGLRVKGDSMLPEIKDADTLIVRKQPDAESGEIVIAAVNGSDAVCKKLYKSENGITLVSLNTEYAPMTYSNLEIRETPVAIIGKVEEIRRKL